jgi:YegS/Rv2252/BmrU family lipid kinase
MLIVFNPTAGRRRPALLWQAMDVLSTHGIRIELAETRFPGHAERLARDAARAGQGMVVAAGGDGTIAEVASGLHGSPAKLGIIPIGTANVLAHELGLPFQARPVAAALSTGHTRPLWPGIASGHAGSRLFVQMMGAGFDAAVVHRLPTGLKRLFGRGAYVMQTLRELVRYDFDPIRLRIDGTDRQAASVIVSKGRYYGGRYLLAPEAQADQPGFSVVLFRHGGPLRTLLYGAALPLGRLGRAPGVEQIRAHEIDFLGNAPRPLQADGDRAGFTPVSIRDASAPIHVVVPA